ncbi:MAG TPA: hypothetical protein VFQ76_13885, partial [Longimicrobiaceae bacterium]|nr:hypothetical protein [Longimicrobiaceae bacterium]
MPTFGTGHGGEALGTGNARISITWFREYPRMKRLLLAAAAALTLAACADVKPSPVEPAPPSYALGDWWNIWGSLKPTDSIDATGGWEVATRFKSSVEGAVVRMRFYRVTG